MWFINQLRGNNFLRLLIIQCVLPPQFLNLLRLKGDRRRHLDTSFLLQFLIQTRQTRSVQIRDALTNILGDWDDSCRFDFRRILVFLPLLLLLVLIATRLFFGPFGGLLLVLLHRHNPVSVFSQDLEGRSKLVVEPDHGKTCGLRPFYSWEGLQDANEAINAP